MSSFAKSVAFLLAGLLATSVAAEKATDPKAKKPVSKEAGDKKAKKKPEAKEPDKDKKTEPEDPDAPPKPLEVPMPNGRDAKGVKLPIRNAQGKMTLRYLIGVAKKVDDTHLEMTDLQVETYNDEGEHEMTMDLPTSVMDLPTWVITAYKPVRIKREDFELTGNTMIFNTLTKQGGLGGNVKMVIEHLFDEPEKAPEAKPEKFTPAPYPTLPPAAAPATPATLPK